VRSRALLAALSVALAWAGAPATDAACEAGSLESTDLVISEATPVRFESDITRRASARLPAGDPFRIKVRRAPRLAQSFNNQPRYELAAYQLQKLLFDPDSEVVPPTALRSMPLPEFRMLDPAAEETFRGTGAALFIVQCWLTGAKPHPDSIDAARFAADPTYALAISNLNVLTFLIEHKDSNAGNVMLVQGADGLARAWAIDNGVAFASEESDLGAFWKNLRVSAIDPGLHERLKGIDRAVLERHLGVLAEFALIDGTWVPQPLGANLGAPSGVRRAGNVLQLGLNRKEIHDVQRRIEALLQRVERGRLALLPVRAD
jgi:hypothetical protein